MAECPERGISESDLVGDITDYYRDARMHWDRLHSYDCGDNCVEGEDVSCTNIIYSQHIASLDEVRALIKVGRKYFPDGETDWDGLDPAICFSEVPSWNDPEDILKNIFTGEIPYKGANITNNLIGICDDSDEE